MRAYYFLFIINFLIGEISFTDITSSAGISFSGMSEGVCVFDYNNDGLDDILFTTRGGGTIHLYKNNGEMNFSNVSIESNIGQEMEARTAVAGDYDNDGDLDVFIGATIGSSKFFRNNGDGSFQDITILTGIDIGDQVRGCSWFDYNQDGHLDLYVGLLYEPNLLYKNNGDGTFIDIAQNVGATGPVGAGIIMGLGAIDYDRDGDQDLYITQDNYNGNILLKNENGSFFTDESYYSQTDLEVMGMGIAFGDINKDGFFDFYTTNLNENSLLLNSSDGVFSDISSASGTQDIIGSMGWGTFFFDANNDGWVDIYNNNETAFGGVYNSLMINQRDLTFDMLGPSCGAIINNNGYGSAFSDFDHDGDLDIILVGHSSTVGSINLLRNDSENRNWIIFELQQNQDNIFAIGSTVELFTANDMQFNFVAAGNSYCSQNTLDIHFGLDTINFIDSVKVIWPDNHEEVFYNIDVNSKNILLRGNGSIMGQLNYTSPISNNFSLKSVYPNPFNAETTISIQAHANIKPHIQIFDLRGNLFKEKVYKLEGGENHQIRLSLGTFPTGIYFLRVQSPQYAVTTKIQLLK